MRRALTLSDGHISGLFNSAFSVIVYLVVLAILLMPVVAWILRRRRAPAAA